MGVFDEDVVGAAVADEFSGLALAHLDELRWVYDGLRGMLLGELELVSQDIRVIWRQGVRYQVDVDSKGKQECKQIKVAGEISSGLFAIKSTG